MNICIIVPSHIHCANRTKLLIRCLNSLINQTTKITIYLSISFETELDKTLFKKKIYTTDLINNKLLCIIYQEQQTSQFRHIERVIDNLKSTYEYVMFCDDDDIYDINRVEHFIIGLKYGLSIKKENEIFVGSYESLVYDINGNPEKFCNHSEKLHEYWSYCVNIEFIVNFINILKINNYDYVIDNVVCDIIFSTYLKSLDNSHLFVPMEIKLYNYSTEDRNSIINNIEAQRKKVNKRRTTVTNNFEEHIQYMNEFYEKEMEIIKSNIFLYVGTQQLRSLDDVLKWILGKNYKYKNKIDQTILSKIEYEYDNVNRLCEFLYNQY